MHIHEYIPRFASWANYVVAAKESVGGDNDIAVTVSCAIEDCQAKMNLLLRNNATRCYCRASEISAHQKR